MSDKATALLPYESTAGRKHLADGYGRPDSLTVDCHGHMIIKASDDLVRPHLPATALDAFVSASPEARAVNKQQGIDRGPHLTGMTERLEIMDKMGVDVMVISVAPPQFNYDADAGLCMESCNIINDAFAKQAAESDRIAAIGTVPMQDTKLAIQELERCMGELGMPGIEIGANAGKDEISAERLEDFWARAEELGAAILLHPTSFASNRLGPHYMSNTIGNPLETTVAVMNLIMDGVMDRYPNLKIVLSHGGAYTAAYAARMDHAFGQRSDCRGKISKLPTEYLKQFHVDNIVFAVDQLEHLVKKFGADHVMIGTDYPFDMGEYDPIEHILQLPGVSEADVAKMCGLNAVDFFGLDASKFGRANFTRGQAAR